MGFDHIMTKKTIARASADVGFIFIAYNLRRILTLIDKKAFIAYLRAFMPLFFADKFEFVLGRSLKKLMRNLIRKIRIIPFFRQAIIDNYKIRIMSDFNPGF